MILIEVADLVHALKEKRYLTFWHQSFTFKF